MVKKSAGKLFKDKILYMLRLNSSLVECYMIILTVLISKYWCFFSLGPKDCIRVIIYIQLLFLR